MRTDSGAVMPTARLPLDLSTLAALAHYRQSPRQALRAALRSLRRDRSRSRYAVSDEQTQCRINAEVMQVRILWPHRA